MINEINLECPSCQGKTVDLHIENGINKDSKVFYYSCRRCVFDTNTYFEKKEAKKEYAKMLKNKKKQRKKEYKK